MSSTKDKVVQYVQHMNKAGRAPKFFGVSQASVNQWLKTGRIPGGAFEKVLDALDGESELTELPEVGPFDVEPLVTQEEPEVLDAVGYEEIKRPATSAEVGDFNEWKLRVENAINEHQRLLFDLHDRLSFLEGNGPANAPQFAPPPAQRGFGQQVFEPNPRDSNAGSMVRPAGTVLQTFAAQPMVSTPPRNLDGSVRKPSDGWLKPRPLRTVVSQ